MMMERSASLLNVGWLRAMMAFMALVRTGQSHTWHA